MMLDTFQELFLVQNVGLFTIGKDLNSAKIAGDLTETNAKIISSVEETSTYKFIPEKIFLRLSIGHWNKLKLKNQKTS